MDKLVPYVSLLATALAVSFDIGYFWGIDINLFTLFSLSEHVLFAIEALPYVLVTLSFIAFEIALGLWLVNPIVDRFIGRQRSPGKATRWALLGAWGAITIALGTYLYLHERYYLLIFISFVSLFLIVFWLTPKRYDNAVLMGGAAASGMVACLLFGHHLAREYIASSAVHHQIELKTGLTFDARLIRSGDKGILYVEPTTKHCVFRHWSEITLVRSKPL